MHRTLALLVFFTCVQASANDWPQWQGPNRDLSSAESGLLSEWPEGGPTKLWSFEDCGKGYSGPAVVGGRVYLLGARDGTTELIVLDADNGQELWSKPLDKVYTNGWGDGPRATPTVDGDRVYCMTANGTLACLASSDGAEIWKTTMQDHGGRVPQWGYSESPLVHGRMLVCTPGGDQGAIVAFDKQTGDVLWRATDLDDGAHYSSIQPAVINGQPQFVQLLEKRLVGVSQQDGSLLWESPWPGRIAVIPTPVVDGNKVYVTSGYGIGCKMVEIKPGNEVVEAYVNKVIKNQHGGVVLLDGYVYGHSDGVGWVCQDFETGEQVWRERGDLGKGALGYADGMLYLISEDEGEVALVRPSPEGWQRHGEFTLDPQTQIRADRGRIWVHPVVVNGKLYLRDQDLVHVYDVSAN